MNKFIIFGSHTDYCATMCNDVLDDPRIYFENADKEDLIKNRMLLFFRRIHLSHRLNSIVPLPLKKIWYKLYLDESRISKDDRNVFVVFDSSFHVYEKEYLSYLKKKFNGTLVLLLVNTVSAIKSHDVESFKKTYDLIYTTDGQDADRYGLHHVPGIYSPFPLEGKQTVSRDLFFVGADKGRLERIHEIAGKAKDNGIHYLFNVIDVPADAMIRDTGIRYNIRMGYGEVVKNIQSSNCLLEIVQEGQSGPTLRAIEAFVYNKKLLTNNAFIKESVFYDPEFVYIYKDVEDMDMDFVKEKLEVDYRYDGYYSPKRLLERIEEELA